MTTAQIRDAYLKFFEENGHKIVRSSSLVPYNDPTLLFTNAGMNQFKDIYLGKEKREYVRATTAQKCVRAGGKQNDLDNVGYTARHHTFFEMLGNFSFGDYFKKEAIHYAWTLLTEVFKLPKESLMVTVYEKDDEAYEMWKAYVIDESHIYRFGEKDNFWAMGDTGPCGPCSEIYYDQGAEHFKGEEDYMGGDGDRFLEIWNLVFMQYERSSDGTLSPLPKPSIDTGMGLERVQAILEGKFSNYDTELFMPLINHVAKLCGIPYEYEKGASYRVIADHIRSVSFLLAQGVNFDKEGRGYVLRRILRRAVRHGYLLGIKEPFMYKLVDTLCEIMGSHYAYLNEKKENIKELIRLEEERFLATIWAGLELFNAELANTKDVFSGGVAFKLYDTYGFPLDLTADMLREKGLSVDSAKFDELMNEQKARAKASWKGSGDAKAESGDFKELLEEFGENEFVGYDNLSWNSRILALLDENFKRVSSLSSGVGYVLLDKTPLYARSGGQCGDTGFVGKNEVLDTTKHFGLNLAQIKVKEPLKVSQSVEVKVNESARLQTRRHHSATHLLHAALRKFLGEHIAQAGSSVEPNRLRFDFSHPKPVTSQELEQIESWVNAQIQKGAKAKTEIMDINSAKNSGAIALFGEKYGEMVRVLTLGESKEFCGGTHVENINEIGSFFITKESGVSAGVRRIEAICAHSATQYTNELRHELGECEIELKNTDLLSAIKKLKAELKAAKDELKNASSNSSLESFDIKGAKVVISEFGGDIKSKIDELKNGADKVIAVLANVKDGKVSLAVGVKGCELKAGEIVSKIAPIINGGGGGRSDFATAGGKDPSRLNEAFKSAKELISASL